MLVAMATASLMIHNTLYCVITQININSDQIFVQFSPFMVKLNSTWGCQLASGHHMSIQHCATCTYIYISDSDCITFENWNVMSLELEALGTLMLVLVEIYQFCSQFQLVPRHVDYQWHPQQHRHHL